MCILTLIILTPLLLTYRTSFMLIIPIYLSGNESISQLLIMLISMEILMGGRDILPISIIIMLSLDDTNTITLKNIGTMNYYLAIESLNILQTFIFFYKVNNPK